MNNKQIEVVDDLKLKDKIKKENTVCEKIVFSQYQNLISQKFCLI